MQLVQAFILLISVIQLPALAENNPFGGQTVYQDSNQGSGNYMGNGIANGVFNRKRENPGNVGRITSQGTGLESKANDASRIAKQGSDVARRTGGGMIGTGIPMILSTILPLQIAGIILTVKGAMELGQSKEFNRASLEFAEGENRLRSSQGNGNGSSASARANEDAALRDRVLTPEVRSALERNGTDPERFIDQILNQGGSATVESVASAFGLTPDQVAEGKANGAETIVVDEMAKISATSNFNSPISEIEIATAQGATSHSDRPDGLLSSDNVSGGSVNTKGARTLTSAPGDTATHSNDFLANLFAGAGGVLESSDEPGKFQLMEIGIQTLPGKRNIFQVARSEYRTFGKWRDKK